MKIEDIKPGQKFRIPGEEGMWEPYEQSFGGVLIVEVTGADQSVLPVGTEVVLIEENPVDAIKKEVLEEIIRSRSYDKKIIEMFMEDLETNGYDFKAAHERIEKAAAEKLKEFNATGKIKWEVPDMKPTETRLEKAIREAEEAQKRLEAVMKEEYKMDDQEFESEVEKRKIKEYIDANKQMWAQYPLMSAFDIVTLLSGTTEDILKLLAEKQLAEKQKELQEREVLPEDGINLTQMYKDASVKDPIQADIEAMINALTGDMEKRKAVNHDFDNFSERMAEQWAEEQLNSMRNPEEEKKSFMDMLQYGTSMTHIDEHGYTTRVVPYSKDYWDAIARKDAQDMKEGKVSNPYHWPTEMLSIEEIVEKYGISQEEVDRLREVINDEEVSERMSCVEAMKPLQEANNLRQEIYYQGQEKKQLEAKVLQWYVQTKDEKYREFMGIKKVEPNEK